MNWTRGPRRPGIRRGNDDQDAGGGAVRPAPAVCNRGSRSGSARAERGPGGVAAGGVCHSDWSVVEGIIAKEFPIILGHEGSARVLETGPGVKLVKPGDSVVLSFLPDCGHCHYCAIGRPNFCDGLLVYRGGTLADGGIRFHR
ncbi:MAG: hypothetical protein FJX77_07825, partial [Armatimonadetes bacterium]|nr:hypothetical protein [Armatimonadota bacterium]